MALPKHLQHGLTPDELTFLAEEELISIVPSFSMTRIRVLSVSYLEWFCMPISAYKTRAYMDHSCPLHRPLYHYGWRCRSSGNESAG
jgi:hypothetical protein